MSAYNVCSYCFGPVCCGRPTIQIEDVSPGTNIAGNNYIAPGMGPMMYQSTPFGTLVGICPADWNVACCGPQGAQQMCGPEGCWTITRQYGCCGPAGCEGCFGNCCGPYCCSCGPEGFFGQCCGPACCSQVFGPAGCCNCGCCGQGFYSCCAFEQCTNSCGWCGPNGCCGDQCCSCDNACGSTDRCCNFGGFPRFPNPFNCCKNLGASLP